MAGIPVTIIGEIFYSVPSTPQPPLGIWGPPGPWVTPPIANVPGVPGYQPPLQIWGPPTMPPGYWGGGMGPGVKPQPIPSHPIVIPLPPDSSLHPEHPIVLPPSDLHPEHPIVIVPPPPPEGTKPPPPEGGWGYSPEYGWGWFSGSGTVPSPK